jgi:hypothetical protein
MKEFNSEFIIWDYVIINFFGINPITVLFRINSVAPTPIIPLSPNDAGNYICELI